MRWLQHALRSDEPILKPTEPPLADQMLSALEDFTEALESGEAIQVTAISIDGIEGGELR